MLVKTSVTLLRRISSINWGIAQIAACPPHGTRSSSGSRISTSGSAPFSPSTSATLSISPTAQASCEMLLDRPASPTMRPAAAPARAPAAGRDTMREDRRACRWRRREPRRSQPVLGCGTARSCPRSSRGARAIRGWSAARAAGGPRWRFLRSLGVSPLRVSILSGRPISSTGVRRFRWTSCASALSGET